MKLTRRESLKVLGGCAAATLFTPLLGADTGKLPTRPVPGTEESLPVVGFGNSQAFRDGDIDRSRELIEVLLEFGGSYIDAGGASRDLLGRIMNEQNLHEELFIGSYASSLDSGDLRQQIGQIRAIDGNDAPMDLVLSSRIEQYSANADTFRRLKEEGFARFVGVARHQQKYHEEMMSLMKAGVVDFVQVNYSMLEPEADERLLPMARDLGVAILVNRPFVNGQYFPLVKGHELPPWAAEFGAHSWAQFSLKFILSHPAVTCVLTETSKTRHARDNLGGGLGPLPDAATREKMRQWIQGLA